MVGAIQLLKKYQMLAIMNRVPQILSRKTALNSNENRKTSMSDIVGCKWTPLMWMKMMGNDNDIK